MPSPSLCWRVSPDEAHPPQLGVVLRRNHPVLARLRLGVDASPEGREVLRRDSRRSGWRMEQIRELLQQRQMTVADLRAHLADLPDTMLVELRVSLFDADDESDVEVEASLTGVYSAEGGPLVLTGDSDTTE